ncbi:hypothetical protein LPY66_12470 [Dehalobacter sp. DCM]|uniref:hypothetical protein n=1 Tax=Dehalobacter sp. DCM TaxID=2907827 RepID=UPI0030815BDE|nr:hypothetical protein LPY66_12470 [Dehalobacter sp. DCM]
MRSRKMNFPKDMLQKVRENLDKRLDNVSVLQIGLTGFSVIFALILIWKLLVIPALNQQEARDTAALIALQTDIRVLEKHTAVYTNRIPTSTSLPQTLDILNETFRAGDVRLEGIDMGLQTIEKGSILKVPVKIRARGDRDHILDVLIGILEQQKSIIVVQDFDINQGIAEITLTILLSDK